MMRLGKDATITSSEFISPMKNSKICCEGVLIM